MAKGLLSASFLLALPLAACAPMPTPAPPPATYLCVAEPASGAIGKAATDAMVEQIRVDTHSRLARVLRPGQVITMEFSAERVNVKVNERNAIIGISCG